MLPVELDAVKERHTAKGRGHVSTEESKAVVRRLVAEMVNKGNTAVAEALVAEDWRSVDPVPGQEQGRKGLLGIVAKMRSAFPDLEWIVEDEVGEGDKVAVCFTMRGTHQGEYMGIPATGKRVTVRGLAIDYCAAGQCKATRMLIDNLSLLQQLGVVPGPGQERKVTA